MGRDCFRTAWGVDGGALPAIAPLGDDTFPL